MPPIVRPPAVRPLAVRPLAGAALAASLALAASFALAAVAAAQEPAAQEPAAPPDTSSAIGPATVRGLAFDSLAWRPLAGARVWTADGQRATVSDSLGRWVLDSVAAAPGTIVAVLAEHAAADSVGLTTLAASATLGADATTELTIAIPAYATLHAAACRGIADAGSPEGGVLFGVVRDAASGDPVAGASVALSWLRVDDAGRRRRTMADVQQVGLVATTDAAGGYYACGIPTTDELTVRATTTRGADAAAAADTLASGEFTVTVGARRILRRDFLLGGAGSATIVARVVAPDGRPLAGARVLVDAGAPEVADRNGRALLAAVPSGTRAVRARAIGFLPGEAIVDVAPGDTAHPVLRLAVAPPQLDAVVVRGSLRLAELEARRVDGYSYVIAGDSLASRPSIESVFWSVPRMLTERRGIDSLIVTMPGRLIPRCAPRVLIDGSPATLYELLMYAPEELLAVEVFLRGQDAPRRYVPLEAIDCGVVLAWTK